MFSLHFIVHEECFHLQACAHCRAIPTNSRPAWKVPDPQSARQTKGYSRNHRRGDGKASLCFRDILLGDIPPGACNKIQTIHLNVHPAKQFVSVQVFVSIPACIQLLEGPYIETIDEVVKAFRPAGLIRKTESAT